MIYKAKHEAYFAGWDTLINDWNGLETNCLPLPHGNWDIIARFWQTCHCRYHFIRLVAARRSGTMWRVTDPWDEYEQYNLYRDEDSVGTLNHYWMAPSVIAWDSPSLMVSRGSRCSWNRTWEQWKQETRSRHCSLGIAMIFVIPYPACRCPYFCKHDSV